MIFKLTLLCSFVFVISCGKSPFGDTEIYSDKIIEQGLKISKPISQSFPTSYVLAGDAITDIDINNVFSGDDQGMSYKCYYDRSVDNEVLIDQECKDVAGVADFNEGSGVFSWRTDVLSPGAYEFRIEGTDYLGRTASELFSVSVRPNYELSSQLLKDHSRFFSKLSGANSNGDAARASWMNLEDTDNPAVLNGFSFSGTSGWNSDFSLAYNGVDNYTGHGVLTSHSQFTMDAWIKPLNVAQASSVIMGNYDEANQQGFQISQASDGSGKLELKINFLSYSRAILNSAPVSYYKLDETSGSTAVDLGSAAQNGTYNAVGLGNAETPISSEPSVSADFNGSSSYVDLGNAPAHQITGDQSIEFWIRPTSFSGRRNPFAKAYGGEGTMTLESAGFINYFYGTNGGNSSPYQGFSSVTSLGLNSWNHVVLVRDLTNSTLRWYINGVETATSGASFPAAAAGPNNTYIGQGYVSRIAGQMSHVAIYNRALSAAEVSAHMQAATTSKCESTTALINNSWYNVAALSDGSNHKLYINNVEECSVSAVYTESTLPLNIGRKASGSYWQGHMGAFRFYNIADPAIVNKNYNATNALY